MAERRVLFLSSNQLTVYHWAGHRLLEPVSFSNDEVGLRAFAAFLRDDRRVPVCVLVDLVEEEFREDTIPHVLPTERGALLRNRLTRLFRDARFSHAVVQGRESAGRRDDRVLFSAINRPELLAPWLAQINDLGVPLAGIYSLALWSERLLRRVPARAPHVLLVSLQSSARLRQSYFVDGRLRVSRLAVLPSLGISQYAAFMLSEVEKVHRYLTSLRVLGRDTPLDVYLLAHGDVLNDLGAQAHEVLGVRYHLVDVAEFSRRSGMRPPIATPFADPVFAWTLAHAPSLPADHYATPADRRVYSTDRLRGAMRAAAVLVLGAALAWSGVQFIDALSTRQDTAQIDREMAFYRERLRIAREELPRTPLGADALRAAVRTATALRAHRLTPLPVLRLVSAGLDAHPELQLDELRWRESANPDATLEENPGMRGRENRRIPASVAPGSRFAIIMVKGRVHPFDGDYRAALEDVNAFARLLGEQPSVRSASVVSEPLDLSSRRSLQGIATARAKVARFVVRVVLRIGAPAKEARG